MSVDIDDEIRLNIARELKEKIEKKIQSSSSSALANSQIYPPNILTDDNYIEDLVLLCD